MEQMAKPRPTADYHGGTMDLRRLRYFVVAAEELNFTRAAERLHMAQPPLSAQIKQLERDVGVRLFDRTSRGVGLTEPGRLLLKEARRVLVQLEQATSMVRRVGDGEVGRMTLGFVPSAADGVLPTVLREFWGRYPDVELFLQEMDPDQEVQRLHDRRIDAGFLYLPLHDPALETKAVSREPFVLALPEAHPLAAEPWVEVRALADEPFILPARYRMPGLHGQILEVCREAGFVPRAVHKEVWLMHTIVGLVAGGIGVALVPASMRHLRRTGVVYKEVKGLLPTVEMAVVWRRDETCPVLHAFLDTVDEISRREAGYTREEYALSSAT
jgi:DNA-binding transcriptional LysR family regulator